METLFQKETLIWDKYSKILDNYPEKNLKLPENSFCKTNFYKNCETLVGKFEKFAVSISGGVDSMLVSYFASMYAIKTKKTLILIHIRYNNRASCEMEEQFLNDWARLIHCKLHVKNIVETRERNSKLREDYEKHTKEIRFNFYKSFSCPILLGHNKDDCYENIFANLSKQIHFENLYGMRDSSIDHGVILIRPFLSIPKKEIIFNARELNIPYLEDSTPAWSTRGRMRDSLIPVVQDFDCNILKGLDEFIKYTKKLEEYWDNHFKEWIKNNVSIIDRKICIKTSDSFYKENCTNMNFWIKTWFTFCDHTNINSRPSNKSIQSLITKLSNEIKVATTHIMSKSVKIIIDKENLVINF